MSKKQLNYLRKIKFNKILILFIQFLLMISFIFIWELLSNLNIINAFIFSSPKKIFICIYKLFISNNLFNHIFTTLYETLLAFIISMLISMVLSTILFLYKKIYLVLNPYLSLFNSLPKVALGPLILIIFGANIKSIVIMGILISIIVTTVMLTNSFYNTDATFLKLMKTLNANKLQTMFYLIFPYNYSTIIAALKLNISMCLIGIVSGEFLVSKEGLGYLIINGTQIFNMDIVFSGIILLLMLSLFLYCIVSFINYLIKKKK